MLLMLLLFKIASIQIKKFKNMVVTVIHIEMFVQMLLKFLACTLFYVHKLHLVKLQPGVYFTKALSVQAFKVQVTQIKNY